MKKQAFNPFLSPDVYIPDGEPHVFGDRVYLFGSHDQENGDTFCALDYEFYSAPIDDLSNWTSKGVNYTAKQDPLYGERMKYMYAPDCVQGNDGRFYLYYCMSGEKGVGGYFNPISVAVCDTPDGRYEYLGVVKNPNGTPLMRYVCFDPAVINDNGTIRLYFGTDYPWFASIPFKSGREQAYMRLSGRTRVEIRAVPEGITGSYHVTLGDDMLTATSVPVRIDNTISGAEYKNHKFFEGSSIRKIGEIYYFIYSSTLNHELCYATSKAPDRDFQFRGTIVSNGDIGYQGRKPKDRLNSTGTNHGSIEMINGQWYVFYHRLTHHSDYSRQACAEKISVLPDGSIPQVEMTSCGLNQGPLAAVGKYPAVICCNLTNGKMTHGSNSKKKLKTPCITSSGDERFVKNITDKTLIAFKFFAFSGPITLTVTTRGSGKGYFEVLTSEKGAALGKIPVTNSQQWVESYADIPMVCASSPLYLRYHGRGSVELLDFLIKRIGAE